MPTLLAAVAAALLLPAFTRGAYLDGQTVYLFSEQMGAFSLVLLSSPSDLTATVAHIGTNTGAAIPTVVMGTTTTQTSATPPIVPVVSNATGMIAVTTTVVVGPNGCDSPTGDPATAFQNVNCASGASQAFSNMEATKANFWAPANGANNVFCKAGRPSCLGELSIIRPNMGAWSERNTRARD